MYSTTGLAVGMAIGVPTFVFIVVFVVFWYRQKLKYKKDLRQHNGIEDYDEVNDLDLDHMIDTPKESHIKDFSTDELVQDGGNERSGRVPEASAHVSSVLGGEGVLIKNGSYSIRKESKIMGLRIIPKDRNINNKNNSKGNGKTNSNESNINGVASKPSTFSISRQHSDLTPVVDFDNDKNYKAYYESVIPVLPGSSLDNRTSISTDGQDASKANTPNTPVKLGSTLGRNSNHSSVEFYKMLQDDSPFYPRSRVTSGVIGETPLRRSNVPNTPTPVADDNTKTQTSADQFFHSPIHSTTAEVSPFDTPPTRNKISERLEREDSSIDFDHPTESTAHDADHVKDSNTNLFEHTINSINETDGDENSALESSPLRKNVHRRINSAESRIILDSNTNAAEESYNIKRKEWLDMYRKK